MSTKAIKQVKPKIEKEDLDESYGIKDLSPKEGDKKVTVIIVNYNSSYPCLKECIDSIKNQTYKNIDILIFDNYSQNNTIELIKNDYNDIRIINSDKNLGLGKALNKAIKEVNSEYILISNFDVTYDKIAIEELVNDINKLGNQIYRACSKNKTLLSKRIY